MAISKSFRHDGREVASIELDADNIEACKETASLLYTTIFSRHGAAAANEIFYKQILSKRQIAEQKNFDLLHTALQRLSGRPPIWHLGEPRPELDGWWHEVTDEAGFADTQSRSVEQVAAELAQENDTMPPESHELRWGPTGTTSQTTMAKQIRRLIKKQFPAMKVK
jgi:hypothetical protein